MCTAHTTHCVCVCVCAQHRIESHSSCTTLHSLFVHSKRLNEEGFQKGEQKNQLLHLLIFYEDQTLGGSTTHCSSFNLAPFQSSAGEFVFKIFKSRAYLCDKLNQEEKGRKQERMKLVHKGSQTDESLLYFPASSPY